MSLNTKAKTRRGGTEGKNTLKGLLFVSPWVLGFLAFAVYPIVASAYYSLTAYDVLRPPRFVGFRNYIELFTRDGNMLVATGNTFWWVGIAVPSGIAAAFLLANLLNVDARGQSAFRAIFFMPTVVPAVVSAFVWGWILNTNWGVIDAMLMSLGFKAIPFLSNPALAKPTLVGIHCWSQGSAIVIYLAALQDVPKPLYEAAVVDGANGWQRFWRITVPLTTPTTLFLLITGLVGAFQNFTFPWLLTGGGPNQATEFYSMYLYRNAFQFLKMGYASALAWILFMFVVIVSLGVFRSSGRWVFYGSGH